MSNDGTIGTWEGYPFQAFEINDGDFLLFHVSDNLDIDECSHIFQMLKETFPKNPVMISNEHIVKGLTILRAPKQTDKIVSIYDNVEVDALLNDIMKGNPNDFLY